MNLKCPGCLALLQVDDDSYSEKVLLQCPECRYVFLARAGEEGEAGEPGAEATGEATLLTSDFAPSGDAREFQWNVPGASLTMIEGDKQGIHLKLRGESCLIGRKGADLALEDKAISRNHCRLEKRSDGWWLRDLGSTNGTFLNGAKVEEARLGHLDELRVGRTRLLFAEAEAPPGRTTLDREPEEVDLTRAEDALREKDLPLPRGREFFLEYMTGPKKARSLKLDQGRIIIGRGPESNLVLEEKGVSRKHVMIEVYSRDQVYISDLASQNGTWLNGIRIRTTRLLHNDLIRIGNIVLKFVVQDLPED